MSLSTIIRPITECNKPVIKIVATPACENNVFINGSAGVVPFPYQIVSNIRGFVRDIPREIVRQNSRNCRVQKVESVIKYEIQGADLYPSWKMRELENSFMQEKIEIDEQEIIFSGGSMFEIAGNSCNKLFRLKTIVEECITRQIFGCPKDCLSTVEVFLIQSTESDIYFSDSGVLIANNYSQLLNFYRGQTGVSAVTDIDAPLEIQCNYYKVFSVVTTGTKPLPFYHDNVSQNNKVFAVTLDVENPDYNKICGGIYNASCAFPIIEPPLVYELVCGDITIGTITQYSIGTSCSLVLFGDWEQHTGDTEIITLGNTRTINLSIINPNYVPTSGTSGTWSTAGGLDPDRCTVPTSIPPTATIDLVTDNGTPVDPADYTFINGVFTFTPCLDLADVVYVEFTTAPANPILTGEVIAQINGTNCLPKTNIYQTNSNNSSIPVGSTLIIKTNGDIQWIGAGTFADGDGTIIEITDIIYEII